MHSLVVEQHAFFQWSILLTREQAGKNKCVKEWHVINNNKILKPLIQIFIFYLWNIFFLWNMSEFWISPLLLLSSQNASFMFVILMTSWLYIVSRYHRIPQLTNQNQAEPCNITEFLMQRQDTRMSRFSYGIVCVSCCVHWVMDKWLSTIQESLGVLQQNTCWDAWRVLNQGLFLWVKICKIKSHEASRGCERTKTMARNG